MKLERLNISNFRGIAGELRLKPDAGNLGLVGPNGSGKSSVVEAIDFLLTGNIQDLTGEGAGGLSVRQHGKHVDAVVEDAWVEADFSLDGDRITLRRTIADRNDLQPERDQLPGQVQDVLDAADRGLHLLSRDEILTFIAARDQSRSERLRRLLNLRNIKDRRLELQGAKENLNEEVSRLEREYESSLNRLFGHFDDDIESYAGVLEAVNDLREKLGGNPLDDLESRSSFRTGLESPAEMASISPLQSVRTQEVLDTLENWFEFDVNTFLDLDAELRERAAEIREDEEAVRALETLQLIKHGQDALDHDAQRCPLCLRDWDSTDLEALLARREERALELQDAKHDLEPLRDDALSMLTDVRTATDSLISILGQHDEFTTEPLVVFKETLAEWESVLEGDLLDVPPPNEATETERRRTIVPEAARNHIEDLGDQADRELSLDELETAWETLGVTTNAYEEVKSNQDQAQEYKRLADEMEVVYDEFLAARDEVLEDIYDEISDSLEHYYTALHRDEDAFSPDLLPTETGLDFEVGFHGRGQYPPNALHSEGHQDSMGLCLYLSLCDWLDEALPIIMLDDVVMSVDADHRRPLAELLASELSERYQLVITTHDDLWHRQLRSAGVLTSSNSRQFTGWSVRDGPELPAESRDEWDEIERRLEDGDVPGAAHKLRRTAEWFLREACHNLNARVEFKADGRWTLSDFIDGALPRYKELLKDAKRAEQSWGNDISHLQEQADKRSEVYQRFNEARGTLNPNVHYNEDESPWANCEPHELRPTLEAYRELYELFWCDNCGGCISLVMDGYEEMGVRCRCGQLADWNLQAQS